MKKVTQKSVQLGKSILSMAVLAAVGLSAQATAVETRDNAVIKTIKTPQTSGVILKLGQSDTVLADKLAGSFTTQAVSQKSVESKKAIAAKVAAAKMLHINLNDFYGTETRLNDYIEAALKQNKLMVFENTESFADIHLDALPVMVAGEVVLFQPEIGDDQLYVYGDGYTIMEKNNAADVGGEDATEQGAARALSTDAVDNDRIRVDAIKLADLQGDQLAAALNTVNLQINQLLDSPKAGKTTVASATGGSAGYNCPQAAEIERLCYTSTIFNAPYYHSDGDAELNIINYASYAMYRTHKDTIIVVSPYGSANPTMKVDTNSKRAFYLKNFSVDITPSLTDMGLKDRYPKNQNNKGSILSSSGVSFTAGVDVATDPSMGASVTYSESTSETMPLSDWETVTTSTGYNAKWDFKLSLNKTISDWVTHGTFQNAKLDAVPNISKYGLQYGAEGVWFSNSKDTTGWYEFSLKTVTQNEQIYFTTNNWFKWAASTTSWTHTVYPGGRNLNRSWLKDL